MSSTLAPSVAGPFIETCKAALPKVTIKFAVSNSDAIRARVEAQTLDIALVFEDELVASFSRKPLFRQRLYFITREPLPDKSVSLGRLAKLPLILPIQPNVMRTVIDRALTAAGIAPNITAEADAISSVLSAVRTGVGNAIIATGNLADVFGDDLPPPLLVEPPLYLTASIIWSSDFPLTHAGEAVRNVLAQYVERYLREHRPPGVRWIGSKTAISTADTPISK
jgi:LysR family nitrogen assimilation transcriptional regulator